ncbi:S8 family serine peptidase, partial [Mesomycoplasma hyorhinis]
MSIIASGKNGINQNSQIYFSNFIDNSSWQNAIEWLVLENNVRVINHSYGSTSINPINYNDESFFIDYISRKYGVVNVFAAGNGYDNPDKDSKWIDKKQLAYNAISVGSTKYRHNVN